MSLRRILSATILILTLLALGAAGSLMVITSYMHHAVSKLAGAVEGGRLLQEASLDLIIHDRAQDRLVQAEGGADLRRVLRRARQYIDPAEEELLARVERQVEVYLAAREEADAEGRSLEEIRERSAPQLERAFSLLQQLANQSVVRAIQEQERSARLDRLANMLGIGVSVVLLLGMSAVLIWLWAFAFRPIFQLSDAIKRFGAGEKGARAPESGPAELQYIARNFNQMSGTIARQQERQLTFLAGVAHDLRNPLSAIKLSSALVRPEHPLPPEEKIHKVFSVITSQVDRLNRMLSDLLDASQIEAGHLDLQKDTCDARDILRGVFDIYQSASPKHSLTLSLPDEPVLTCCDAPRVEQALVNLVSNAIKYSPEGGKVGLSLERVQKEALFRVADEGMGIEPSEQARLFEPFQRLGAARGKLPGAGLGLFVAGRIVKAHGGDIQVKSAPGQGSSFSISLPLAAT